MKRQDIITVVARVVIGGIMFYAGFMKAAGPLPEFAAAIAAYKILPAFAITPFSIALPYLEMWIGSFLIAGFFTRRAAVASMLLCSMFFIALVSSFARGIDLVSCGCFGADTLSPKYTLGIDAALIALSFTLYRLTNYPPRWSLDQSLH